MPFQDLSGQRFGRLTVSHRNGTRLAGKDHQKIPTYECRCDCGNLATVAARHLRAGFTTSCGCALDESRRTSRPIKHGKAYSPEHKSWTAAKQRCFNPNYTQYKSYGGRGITMCAEWRDSFEAFYRDMGDRPAGTTLDRINNDGNYEPGNCRWATPKEQTSNRRSGLAAFKATIAARTRAA